MGLAIAITLTEFDPDRLGGQIPSPEGLHGGTYPYYVLIDRDTGEELLTVDFEVKPGDEFLTADNRLYRVEYVEANRGYSVFLRDVRLMK